ncbi:hypothetical protein AMTR_s00110p00148540 [Amborella trichopoda]|uniref:Uncharacterized protein n=1 Tax=Amborella trichopoda TaxID=13333 RepID=W1NXC6_AMBTC|nr:hypothetical protein AMTR_s00110p00148540 [Amborella trichopoda]
MRFQATGSWGRSHSSFGGKVRSYKPGAHDESSQGSIRLEKDFEAASMGSRPKVITIDPQDSKLFLPTYFGFEPLLGLDLGSLLMQGTAV